ncbi:hypothetical protein AB4099_34770 [Bosea sp. 2KB_26]|uniref:hypothetical protein n=1 Tax=Bosea sp. 2KB_26 TaxID=3237475 RepID=UPI003F91B75E
MTNDKRGQTRRLGARLVVIPCGVGPDDAEGGALRETADDYGRRHPDSAARHGKPRPYRLALDQSCANSGTWRFARNRTLAGGKTAAGWRSNTDVRGVLSEGRGVAIS